jgi:hypothetical protein
MGAVTTDDLIRYKTESLLKDKNRRTGKVYESMTVETHLATIRTIFELAHTHTKISSNPADHKALRHKGKTRPENKRKTFTDDERRRILLAARDAEPAIRWSTWIGHFLGARNAEIFEADTRDIEEQSREYDGGPVFHIRLDYRSDKMRSKVDEISPRPNPLHSAGKVGREYGYYPMDKMRGGVEKIANPLAESESDTRNAPAHRR